MAFRDAIPKMNFAARKNLARLCRQFGREQALQEYRWMMMESKILNPLAPSPGASLTLARMLRRRARGEPLQYILGTQPFGSLDVFVEPPTLIPRPETEEWAIWLAATLLNAQRDQREPSRRPRKILDLCTGSGCIPLLLCSELPRGTIKALGVDISSAAITLANRNRDKYAYASSKSSGPQRNRFEVLQSDIFSPQFTKVLQDHPLYPFDVITSNPPYITRTEYKRLPHSVKSYEDPLALIGEAPVPRHPTSSAIDTQCSVVDTAGLAFYRRITNLMIIDQSLVQPGGNVVFEVGINQAAAVRELLSQALRDRADFIHIWKDASGIERVVRAKLL